MWQPILTYARQLFKIKEQTEKNAADTEEIQEQVKEIASGLQSLAYVVQRNHDNEAHEREKLALRLENLLLRAERSLPPGPPQGEGLSEEAKKLIEELKRENETLRKRVEQLESQQKEEEN